MKCRYVTSCKGAFFLLSTFALNFLFCSAKKKMETSTRFLSEKLEVERGYITKEKFRKVKDAFVFRIN